MTTGVVTFQGTDLVGPEIRFRESIPVAQVLPDGDWSEVQAHWVVRLSGEASADRPTPMVGARRSDGEKFRISVVEEPLA
ncbi:hypothetical protein CcI49_24815 [Frankia sp. CcI49]|nr:hypothetical protein CcI49_24815 [Frankia sp. CcI49]